MVGAGAAEEGAATTWVWRVVPVAAFVVLAIAWGRDLPAGVLVVVAIVLAAAVVAAVHHAEVVAHRVGEPYGSIILAVAVTVIEVGRIVSIMLGGGDGVETLARDTVFAAVMITLNGIVGLTLLVETRRGGIAHFNGEGTGGALASVATVAVLCLVLPTTTESASGPRFTAGQLAFAAVASLATYAVFVVTQTIRHRDFFLPVNDDGSPLRDEDHAQPPPDRVAWTSFALLVVALVGVVGLAKTTSPGIEAVVEGAGLPPSFVGVVIALLILSPESIAACNAAVRGRTQVGLNLGLGSAMASIALTIPAIAVASIWLPTDLVLGLGGTQMVLLALSVVVGVLTVVPGRATRLQASLHLALLAAFLYFSISP
ncbi:MAG: calcium:proton antiporter [Phycicoccus sp.]